MATQETVDLANRAQAIYDERLRARLEQTNRGDFVTIEPDSGDYFIGKEMSQATQAARAAHPNRRTFYDPHRLQGGRRVWSSDHMTGEVDPSGRALIVVTLRAGSDPSGTVLPAWIDTGFIGELAMPRRIIERLQLPISSNVLAALADGSEVMLKTYACSVNCFGNDRVVEVIESEALLTLLGIRLLQGHRLEVDYRASAVTID